MLKKELYGILLNKKTYVVFFILLGITFFDLYINYHNNITSHIKYGEPVAWSQVDIAPHLTFVANSSEGHITAMLYQWIFPLYILVVSADSYVSEYKCGAYKALSTRSSKKKVFFTKLLATFMISFAMVFITCSINYICCLIVFGQGTDIDLFERLQRDGAFQAFIASYPYSMLFVYIIINSIVLSLSGVMCAALSFCILDLKYLYGVSLMFWLIMVMSPWDIMSVLQPFTECGLDMIIPAFCTLLLFVAGSIAVGYKKKVLSDEL